MPCPKFIIYGLCDPRTKEIRYVGKSCTGLKRPKEHLFHYQNKIKTYKNCWIRSLLKEGVSPSILVLEECERQLLDEREVFWINHYRRLGYKLTNMTTGGTGGNTGGSYKKHKPVLSINAVTYQAKRYNFVWETAKDGFAATKVVAVCKGRRKSHKGHYFHYETEQFVEPIKKTMRPIICKNKTTGEVRVFKSIQECSKHIGLCLHTISTALSGKTICRSHEFIKASHVNERYEPVNKPIRIEL